MLRGYVNRVCQEGIKAFTLRSWELQAATPPKRVGYI